MSIFDKIKSTAGSAANSVSAKAKAGSDLVRLSNEAHKIAEELNGLYSRIGQLYVDSKGIAHGEMGPLCVRALELRAQLTELEEKKAGIKNERRCPACGAKCARSAAFCAACGSPLEKAAPLKPAPVKVSPVKTAVSAQEEPDYEDFFDEDEDKGSDEDIIVRPVE